MARRTKGRSRNKPQQQRCPVCDEPLLAESINIQEGVALCPGCGKLSRLSELNYSDRSVEEILSNPPSGCIIESQGKRVIVSASFRSLSGFLSTAFFALFWNSIVSVFVLVALAGLYTNLIGPLPEWFPAPDMADGKPEMNGKPMSLRMTLFLCVFLIPFVTIGVGMLGAAILNLIGKIELVIDRMDSYVATGIGIFKWKRRFDPHEVHSVDLVTSKWQSEGQTSNQVIELQADRTVKFGSMLKEERLSWLRIVLRELLLNSQDPRYASILPYQTWLVR